MSSVDKVRESVDVRFDKLQARAEALQTGLESTKDQIEERIARHKQEAQQVLRKLGADIDKHADLPAARQQAVGSLVGNLDQQIGLIQSASRATLASARQQLRDGVRKMEAELDAALAEGRTVSVEAMQASIAAYARALNKLDAELEAAEHRFASSRDRFDEAFKKGRQEIAQEIAKLKQRIAEKETHAGEKLASFEQDLSAGLERVVTAFRDLFS